MRSIVDRIELHERVHWRAGDADKGADRSLVPTETSGDVRLSYLGPEIVRALLAGRVNSRIF